MFLGLYACNSEVPLEDETNKESVLPTRTLSRFEMSGLVSDLDFANDDLRANIGLEGEHKLPITIMELSKLTTEVNARWGVKYKGNSYKGMNCSEAVDQLPENFPSNNTIVFLADPQKKSISGASIKMLCVSSELKNVSQGWMCLDGVEGKGNNATKQYFMSKANTGSGLVSLNTDPNDKLQAVYDLEDKRSQEDRHLPLMTSVLPIDEFSKPLKDSKVRFSPRGSLFGLFVQNKTDQDIKLTHIVVKKDENFAYSGFFDWKNTKKIKNNLYKASFTPAYPDELKNKTALIFPVYTKEKPNEIGCELPTSNQKSPCFYVWAYPNKGEIKNKPFRVQIRYQLKAYPNKQFTTGTFVINSKNKTFSDGKAYNVTLKIDKTNMIGGSTGEDWLDGHTLTVVDTGVKPAPSRYVELTGTKVEGLPIKNLTQSQENYPRLNTNGRYKEIIIKIHSIENLNKATVLLDKKLLAWKLEELGSATADNNRTFKLTVPTNTTPKTQVGTITIDFKDGDRRKFTVTADPTVYIEDDAFSTGRTPLDFVSEATGVNGTANALITHFDIYYSPEWSNSSSPYEVGMFSFAAAKAMFSKPFLKDYMLPNVYQWQSIIPADPLTSKDYVLFHQDPEGMRVRTLYEKAQVGQNGEVKTYKSQFITKKEGNNYYVTYALRFIGTKWESAWRYSIEEIKSGISSSEAKKLGRCDFIIKSIPLNGQSKIQKTLSAIQNPDLYWNYNNPTTVRRFPSYGTGGYQYNSPNPNDIIRFYLKGYGRMTSFACSTEGGRLTKAFPEWDAYLKDRTLSKEEQEAGIVYEPENNLGHPTVYRPMLSFSYNDSDPTKGIEKGYAFVAKHMIYFKRVVRPFYKELPPPTKR